MKDPQTIDVLLPYYGDSAQLRDAVRSVLAQSHPGWRLFCVDDAHPTSSAEGWLRSLQDPRIHHLRNERNLGVAGNFARCLTLATNPWLTMMGSDDLMRPDHLATALRRISARSDVDIVQCGVRVIDDTGAPSLPLPDRVKRALRPRTPQHERLLRGEDLAASLTRADWAYFPSLLWRTERAQRIGFRPEYAIALDLGLLLDVTLDGGAMLLHDEVTFEYRRHRASASMSTARNGARFDQERRFFRDYAARFRDVGWDRPARIAERYAISRLNALSEVPGALASGDLVAARRLLAHVVLP